MQSKGRRFHELADQIREEGNFGVALNLHNLALHSYSIDKDNFGFSESLADMSITYRHMASKVNDSNYLILSLHFAKAAVEVAENKGLEVAFAVAYFNLAKAYDYLKDFSKAVEFFKKASDSLENNPPQSHNRLAIKADFQIHLGKAMYESGDKTGLEIIEDGIKKLDSIEGVEGDIERDFTLESAYNKNVWLSGAYMYMAEILKEDHLEKARESLVKAKEIIDSDDRLSLRLEQWREIEKLLK